MKRPGAFELLAIWESTQHLSLLERSLYLLSVVYETDTGTIAKLSIGDRDAGLLRFRKKIFGSRLINMAYCPGCGKPVEWETTVDEILLQDIIPDAGMKVFKLESEGYTIDFRLPNSDDIMTAMASGNRQVDVSSFISSCILHIDHLQKNDLTPALPQKVIEDISLRMSEADPQAEISMVLNCPDCKNEWRASFNILSYLWLEIESWAKRILKEVAMLARAFGWSEKEILSLSPQRRQYYLGLINA
jgi:hypothetical protein